MREFYIHKKKFFFSKIFVGSVALANGEGLTTKGDCEKIILICLFSEFEKNRLSFASITEKSFSLVTIASGLYNTKPRNRNIVKVRPLPYW